LRDVAKVYERIEPRMARWIGEQPVFFVATAPLDGDGLVNVSPKGLRGTFGVLDDHTFAYVDMTASGIETTAHLRENGRICVMFCSFDGTPNVVRLHGRGRVVTHGEPGFSAALEPFAMGLAARRTEARGVVTVDVTRVADACGYAVPRMTLESDRELLDSWAERRSPEWLRNYRTEKNQHSLDGLPGLAGLPDW
jgi:predicted pyridoxine 5'-phosphate oxidase superfamily flavin-nucleotide-binding protein